MYSCCCPVCHISLPISEIDRHVNNHFEDEDEVLAHQIALAPPSPTPTPPHMFELTHEEAPESSTSRNDEMSSNCELKDIHEQTSCIISIQSRAAFYRVEAGLINLLKNCLEREDSMSILSGYVDHFQSTRSEDMGWGCGWRNIQMLTSHLIFQRPEAREALFGGSQFVPDIASLQGWLEVAWHKGFDIAGSQYFKGKVYGTQKWIGTTECAALFQSFGLRARIVDFDGKGSNRNVGKTYGPMDKFVIRNKTNTEEDGDKFGDCSKHDNRGFQALVDWVWRYFSKNEAKGSSNHRVLVTNKMPLYFQHQGHSRTIIGIQVKHQKTGVKDYNLLVLDPAHSTQALERSLKQNLGWQKLLKRGLHTLKKPQYQLCYVDPGIATSEEMEQLKIMDSTLIVC